MNTTTCEFTMSDQSVTGVTAVANGPLAVVLPDTTEIQSHPCFAEPVADCVMCDSRQEAAFDVLGTQPNPFANFAKLPTLDKLLAMASSRKRDELGEQKWHELGGCEDPRTGRPTFSLSSDGAAGVVRELTDRQHGFRYVDPQGIAWAVSISPHCVRGLPGPWAVAIACEQWLRDSNSAVANAAVARDGSQPDSGAETAMEQQGQGAAPQVSRCTAQLLWLIYHAVRHQRNSTVVLPDVTLATAIWGGHERPDNWRGFLYHALCQLMRLRLRVLKLRPGGWRPTVMLDAVAVAAVEKLETGPRPSACELQACPLRHDAGRHGHFVVEVGRGFLGAFEDFAIPSDRRGQEYDFAGTPKGEAGLRLKAARNDGYLLTVKGNAYE